MELRHLRHFLAVAEELNFSRAAKRLRIGKSPLSKSIKELEARLQVQLFLRNTHHTRLTLAGQAFLQNVKQIFVVLEQAQRNAQAIERGAHHSLRIALTDDTDLDRITELLEFYREEQPDIGIQLFEVTLAQLTRGIRGELYDIGLTQYRIEETNISTVKVWDSEIQVILSPHHPLLIHTALPLRLIAEQPLILLGTDYNEGHYQQIQDLFGSVDARISNVKIQRSPELILSLVSAGYGVSLISKHHATRHRAKRIVTRPIEDGTHKLNTYMACKHNRQSAHIHQFIDKARETCHNANRMH